MADCLLRASGNGYGSWRSGLAGHLRSAAGVPPDGQTARLIRVFGAGGESVLSHQEGPDRGTGRGNANPGSDAPHARRDERNHTDDRRESVHRMAGPTSVRRQEPEDGDAGLLHGRPVCPSHGSRVPIASEQPASFHGVEPSPICRTARIYRLRKQRRSFSSPSRRMTILSGPMDKTVMKDTFAKANVPAEIEVYTGAQAWLVPSGLRCVQPGPGRERPGAACSRSTEKPSPRVRG